MKTRTSNKPSGFMFKTIISRMTILFAVGFVMSMVISQEARADGWLPPAGITEFASTGEGEKFVRLNVAGNGYLAGTPVYIYYDPNDAKINNVNHQKEFYAQLMMAFALGKKVRVEVFQKTYPDTRGKVVTRWVMQSIMLHPED